MSMDISWLNWLGSGEGEGEGIASTGLSEGGTLRIRKLNLFSCIKDLILYCNGPFQEIKNKN